MPMITKLEFILFYTVFLFCVVQLSSMAGVSIVKNAPSPPTIPPQPTIIDYIVYPISNIGYFFSLMAVSSDYLIFGTLVISPFIIGLIWTILELVRGV